MKRLQHEELKVEAQAIERRLQACPDISERRLLQARQAEIARLLADAPTELPESGEAVTPPRDAESEGRE